MSRTTARVDGERPGLLGRLPWRDRLFALLLLFAAAGSLGLAQRNLGVMRDEGTYFDAARAYWGWFAKLGDPRSKAFSKAQISQYFHTNNEHPVLLKTAFALSWRLFHGPDKRQALLDEISAFRLPAWLLTGLAISLVYLLGVRIESRTAGLIAALVLWTMPRVFFHGQLACFDTAIMSTWLLAIYAYLRGLMQLRWALAAGVCWGIALATKHNAWIMPGFLLLHYLVVVWPDLSLRPLRLPRIPLVFVSMALIGPLVFYLHWPWLWFDTVKHVQDYFAFHLHHAYYNMEFLGTNYGRPPLPISYPFVMTLFTVPTVTLLLALAGGFVYLRRPAGLALARIRRQRPPREDSPFRFPARRSWLRPAKGLDPRIGLLLTLTALIPILLIAHPNTPIFGGTKHWLPAYPFVALLAGVAASRLLARLGLVARRRALAAVGLALVVALPGALNIYQTHPFGLSQYNAIAGGVAGGADLGLNRQFWGYAPRQLLPWLNSELRGNTSVYFHDVNYASYAAYRRAGLLRNDIRYSGMELPAIQASRAAMVVHELHFNKYDYWIWRSYGHPSPTKVLTLDGVPLVSVYQR